MDARLRNLALLGSLALITLVAILVFFANEQKQKTDAGSTGTGKEAQVEASYGGTTTAGTPEKIVSGQVGNDLKGFLRDPNFFDQPENPILEQALDQSNALSILATSVEKDLRVQIVDINGERVSGLDASIRLKTADGKTDDYKDPDKDGLIYLGSLSAGEYEVQLLPVPDYKVPLTPTKIKVKNQVEYVAIDDISVLIRTEAEIDAQKEDTMVADALEEGDSSEIVQLQPGGNRQKLGIDVSKYQKEIDWEKVAQAGIQFAIIRCGYRGSVTGSLVEDPYFAANIRGAKAAGIQVGIYFFTQAITEAEAVEEASAAMALVQEYQLELPIYIDTEGAGGNGRADSLDVEQRTLVCEAFCRTIVNAGRSAGIYASRNWLNKRLMTEKLQSYEIWLAEYRSIPLYEGYYTMWQYTSKGSVDGIEGNVDLDLYYY